MGHNMSGGNTFLDIDIGSPMFTATGVITVLILLSFMVLANILRRKVPFLRKSMMPTALIGGIIVFFVKELLGIWFAESMSMLFNEDMLFSLVYHLLPVGFIALGLRDKDNYEGDPNAKTASPVSPMKSGAVIVSSYMMQGAIGIGLSILLSFAFTDLFAGAGVILPLGFGQGPGQATNGGKIFEQAGMIDGRDFGIAISSIGFLWASIGGVILLNIIAKKRKIKLNVDSVKYETAKRAGVADVELADEIPLTEAVDKFTIQICLIGLLYLLTFLTCLGVDRVCSFLGKTGADIATVLWGFNFCIGIVYAMLAKLVINQLRKKKIMMRRYPNTYMLNRISGFAFDFMIIAALATLTFAGIVRYWAPLLIITTVGGVVTIFYLRFITRRINKGYEDEAFVAMYGTMTGTLSNAMILLRELDPDFKTPAAMDQVLGATTGLVFGLPILFLIQMAVGSPYVVLGVVTAYFFALFAYLLAPIGRKRAGYSIQKDGGADSSAVPPDNTKD